MKPRNREVTIFSLSMMDVISGAMGAFLVLVVILSRHYQPNPVVTEAILNLQAELVEATGYLEEASDEIQAGSRDTVDIERFLKQAKRNVNAGKAYIAQLKNELDEANAKILKLEEEVKELEERVTKLESRLASWEPFVFMSYWKCSSKADVDVYLESSGEAENNRVMEPFNPKRQQGRLFSDDISFDYGIGTTGADSWFSGRNQSGEVLRVYYRMYEKSANQPVCTVDSWLTSNVTKDFQVQRIKLSDDQPWIYVGHITISEEHHPVFKPASAEERAREHAEISERLRRQ